MIRLVSNIRWECSLVLVEEKAHRGLFYSTVGTMESMKFTDVDGTVVTRRNEPGIRIRTLTALFFLLLAALLAVGVGVIVHFTTSSSGCQVNWPSAALSNLFSDDYMLQKCSIISKETKKCKF